MPTDIIYNIVLELANYTIKKGIETIPIIFQDVIKDTQLFEQVIGLTELIEQLKK